MAITNKNKVSAAYNGSCLYNSKGMAKALLMLSKIQFSIFRLASSHIPAHAVALTHESASGTVESVKFTSTVYNNTNAATTIASTIVQSRFVQRMMAGAA